MLNLSQEKIDLQDSQYFQQVNNDVELLLSNWEIGEAYDYLTQLLKLIGLSKDLKIKYEKALVKLSCFTLPFLEDKEVENLIKNKLLLILQLNIDLNWSMEQRIYFYYDNALDWQERRKFINYLNANAEVLGDVKLEIVGQSFLPTIGSWLKDYNLTININQPRSGYEEVTYLNTNPNARKLKNNLKTLLLEILKLYDNLLYPAYRQSIEVTSSRQSSSIKDDKPLIETPISATVNQSANLAQIADLYQARLTALQNKYQINQGILTYKDYQLTQLKDLLLSEIKNPKIALPVLAVIIAHDGGLKLLETELPVKLAIGENSKNKLKEAICKLLLGASLTESEAAIYAMHLAKSNKTLAGLAYADLKDSTFKLR